MSGLFSRPTPCSKLQLKSGRWAFNAENYQQVTQPEPLAREQKCTWARAELIHRPFNRAGFNFADGVLQQSCSVFSQYFDALLQRVDIPCKDMGQMMRWT